MSYINKITTKKGTTRWQCRWNVPNPGGGPKERSKNFATQKEAKAHAVQMAEIESRGVGDPRKHDLAGYLRGWLAHLREREDLAPTTMEGYERNVELCLSPHRPDRAREVGAARPRPAVYDADETGRRAAEGRQAVAAAVAAIGAALSPHAAHRARTGPQMETDRA